jgi:hypothetical protein
VAIDIAARTITVTTGGLPRTITLNCQAVFQDTAQSGLPLEENNAILNKEYPPVCYQDPKQPNPDVPSCAKFYSTLSVVYWTHTLFNDKTPDSYRTSLIQRSIDITASPGYDFELWAEFYYEPLGGEAGHSGSAPNPVFHVHFS